MVTRVTTSGNYSAVLQNLMAAQQRQADASDKVSTGKNGTSLKDFAKSSELLTGMRTVQARIEVYRDQNKVISDKLTNQDQALNRVADAAQAVKQIFMDAIASGRADTLVTDVEAQLRNAVDGMNARYDGKYLFAGGQIDTKPVTVTTLTDLNPPAVVANMFLNDNFKTTAKVDDAATVTTGMLASDIGTGLLNALQAFQTFNTGGSGPFSGQLTPAQQTFLEGQIATWSTIRSDVTNMAAANGVNQKRVDNVAVDLEGRSNALVGMISDITDADMGEASAQLEQSQLAVQSAAYVFQALKESSLLKLLG